MTNTNTGSPDDTAMPDGQGDSGGITGGKVPIKVAIIAGIAAVAAAVIPVVLIHDEGSNPPRPTTSSVDPTGDDPCDLNRLGDSWNQPPASRFNVSLFANRLRPSVYTVVSPGSSPEVSVKGQLSLDVPAGQVLYLIRRPDPETKDSYGNPGNGRYYPATPVTPTSAGCWEDDNRPVGYPGVKGIGQLYILVLVGRDQAAEFPADRAAKGWDGYSQDQWRALNFIDVMSFNVPT
ncbi:hypothetical protein ACWD3I_46975 [Streptomyces sp. NPDC002817]|uniref:hypothetical protein n=1 Tax=Streptomyces sp. NPDC088357 TaxID=3154655 RepID=UPI0034152ADE